MKSNNHPDGKQASIPTAIQQRFEAATPSFLDARRLHTMWQLLDGEVYVASREQRKALAAGARIGRSFEELHNAAEVYNACLSNDGRKPRRRDRNSGRVLRRKLSKLVCVLPTGEAVRMPAFADPRISGPVDHQDTIGRVTSDRTLRPIHQALLAVICGLYVDREIYRDRGMISLENDVMLSANKALWILVSTRKAGGANIDYMQQAFADLAGSTVRADVDEDLPGSRDHAIDGKWFDNVMRAVDGDDGLPEWVDLDDPRPTTKKLGNPYKFTLSKNLKRKLDGDRRNLVFFNARVWRELTPQAGRIFVWLQASRVKQISHGGRTFAGVHFFAAQPLLNQLGLTQARRYNSVRDTLWASLLNIQRVCNRYEWVSEPWRPLQTYGLAYYHFCIRLAGSTKADIRGGWGDASRTMRKTWLADERNLTYLAAYYAKCADAGVPPPLML